jgi:hypothetical protein
MSTGAVPLIASASLVAAGLSSAAIAVDLVTGRKQKMAIMNLVWPLTALWAGPLGLWAYLRVGRPDSAQARAAAERAGDPPPHERQPFPVLVAKAATHCGAGCTLGDLVAESLAVVLPLELWGYKIFGSWIYDFVLAFAFGIGFQYFTIKPMRGLSRRAGLAEAFKADALSLTAWQLGMYGWMAIATFAIMGHELSKSGPVFWFMMQIAMVCGFATSYPVNWWLLRRGIKEKM